MPCAHAGRVIQIWTPGLLAGDLLQGSGRVGRPGLTGVELLDATENRVTKVTPATRLSRVAIWVGSRKDERTSVCLYKQLQTQCQPTANQLPGAPRG